jgi:hypothetical protein
MTPSSAAWSGQGFHPGCLMRKRTRRMRRMCKTISENAQRLLDNRKYRLYAEAKAHIPKDLSPKEYEEEVKKLAKKFRI